MNEAQSRDAINGAALVVAGIYFYRKLIEPAVGPSASGGASSAGLIAGEHSPQLVSLTEPGTITGAGAQLLGVGPLASTGRFVVGFGFTFLVLSLMQGASPELAGGFALLIALGSILGNGIQVASDVRDQLHLKPTLPKTSGEASPAPTVQVADWEPAGAAPEGFAPSTAAKPSHRRPRRSQKQKQATGTVST